jgi:hypothetical protein
MFHHVVDTDDTNGGERGRTTPSSFSKRPSPISPKAEPAPDAMSVSALATECKREISTYGREGPSSDAYSVELLLRATVYESQEARASLQECLSEVVRNWLHHHPRREIVCLRNSEEDYLARTFERFWQAAAHAQERAFGSLALALRYLHASLNGVLLETLRTFSRQGAVSIPGPRESGDPDMEDAIPAAEVWAVLKSMLPDAREQRLAYLFFHCGLSPREVVRCRPEEFDDLHEISRLRRDMLERLCRFSDQLRCWRLARHGNREEGDGAGGEECSERQDVYPTCPDTSGQEDLL